MTNKWIDVGNSMRAGQEAGAYGIVWHALRTYRIFKPEEVVWNGIDNIVKLAFFRELNGL
jgi:hypothetical protein